MSVTSNSPAVRGVIAFPAAASGTAASESLPSELGPFRRGDLRDEAEATRLLEQRLARPVIADVLVAFDAPDNLELRCAAAALLLPAEVREQHGWVLGFGSAAWLHTGTGSTRRAPSELHVIIPPGRRRPRAPGVRGRQIALPREHVMFLDRIAVTDPVRTAADVARDLPTAEALSALRRLAELTGVRPHQVTKLLATMRYSRGAATARQLIKNWAEEG
jgi:hypothetical protein